MGENPAAQFQLLLNSEEALQEAYSGLFFIEIRVNCSAAGRGIPKILKEAPLFIDVYT
jgi:hypothetical protein